MKKFFIGKISLCERIYENLIFLLFIENIIRPQSNLSFDERIYKNRI